MATGGRGRRLRAALGAGYRRRAAKPGDRTYLARLGLAPDDRVSLFSLSEKR